MLFRVKRGLRVWIGLLLCGVCFIVIASHYSPLLDEKTRGDNVPVIVATTVGIAGVCLIAGPLPALAVGLGLSFAGCGGGGGGGGGDEDLGEPPAPPLNLFGQK